MSLFSCFHLSPASRKPVVATRLTVPPLILRLDFSAGLHGGIPDNAKSPTTSRSIGSFNHDRELGRFNLEWANLAEFETWCHVEECASSIELVASSTRTPAGGKLYSQSQKFVCGRQRSGGEKAYEKKHPERERKVTTKKTGCRCQVLIKEYPHMSKVLGRYIADHDHKIGAANIAYTCLSSLTWERIKIMLTQTIDRSEIVSC